VTTPLLRVENLEKTFTLHLLGGKRVEGLRPVSFEIAEGAFVAVVGPSGGGKSTLLKCLYRTYLPSAGRALYRLADETVTDLAGATDAEIVAIRGREIGYVSQFLRPTPRVTAVDLVATPLRDRGVSTTEARERAGALLRRLALPTDHLDGFPALFSGGEQQRVNIARALIAPSRFLLLDEPTSALDAGNQETVVELLDEARQSGTTILGIFHDIDLVRRLADHVLAFDHGRLVSSGTVEHLPPQLRVTA
jgi:alpha-D-ribose 1-methylphosphonate 5-triphosphate synthase subunit PhnL